MFNWAGKRKMPLFRQSSVAECGLACVGMIACHYGHKTDLPSLRRSFHISMKGTRLTDLVAIAEELGMGCRALKCEPEHLGSLRLPAILHWNMKHFVVLKRVIGGQKFEVYDPDQGRRMLSLNELDTQFTGVALELVPTASFSPRNESNPVRLTSLVHFDGGMVKPVLQALALSCCLQVFVLIAPFFIQLVIDEAILQSDLGLLYAIAIGFGSLKLFEIATTIFRRIVFQLIGKVLTFDLKASLFHHLLRLPISYFVSRGTGDVQQRFTSLQTISLFVVDGLIEAIVDGLLAVLIGIILFAYNPVLGTIVLCFVGAYLVFGLLCLRISKRLELDQQVAIAGEATRFLETLRAVQTIKIAGVESERENIWRNAAAETVNADIRVGNMRIAYDSVSDGLMGLSQIVIVGLAAIAVIQGTMTIGMITAFLAYKLQFERRLIALLDKWIAFKLLDVHLERVSDIALTDREFDLGARPGSGSFGGAVEFRNVTFRYAPRDPYVLQGLNLRIEPGEFVALTGPSGQGKSTLISLLVGIYRPTAGDILYDSKPISAWGAKAIRQQIGVVMQNDQLLSGSIEENIALFDPNPDIERIRWAAEAAQIISEIEAMPMGFNSLVGDMGTSLSGGQQQRIIIARALYRQPRLLVLDEGTSQVDVATEIKINEALRELKITRVAAAHRPDTLEKADRVIHVLNGVAFEDGHECRPSSLHILSTPNL